ncbi:MAG TPA: porin, partial [Methylibium sp.]
MMKKSLIALAALAAFAGAAQAQSGVNLYGIVDLGLRHSNNEGLSKGSENQETAGMSQSRWGINVNEDMGGGLRTLVNLENRFSAQNGAIANAAQWSQSWVGIQSSDFGQIRLGRQYNVLFDVMTTTYVPFKFSPYLEVFKPETIGHLSGGVTGLGSRNDNMVKYLATLGAFTFEAQVSALQGDPTLVKSWGAAAKYGFGELALGGGYLEEKAMNGGKAKAYNLGVGYTSGPLYLNASYAHSTF